MNSEADTVIQVTNDVSQPVANKDEPGARVKRSIDEITPNKTKEPTPGQLAATKKARAAKKAKREMLNKVWENNPDRIVDFYTEVVKGKKEPIVSFSKDTSEEQPQINEIKSENKSTVSTIDMVAENDKMSTSEWLHKYGFLATLATAATVFFGTMFRNHHNSSSTASVTPPSQDQPPLVPATASYSASPTGRADNFIFQPSPVYHII